MKVMLPDLGSWHSDLQRGSMNTLTSLPPPLANLLAVVPNGREDKGAC